jgi:SagB-type dehydrogenase family enzyme
MLPFEDTNTLSLLFHLNSEPWGNSEAYQSPTYGVEYKQFPACLPEVALPATEESPLRTLLRRRASCRAYDRKPLPLASAAALLSGAYGISRVDREILEGSAALLRPVPSAGGLFPLELYAISQNVSSLPDGLHHFNVRNHSLEPLKTDFPLGSLSRSLYMFSEIQDANLVVFLVGVFERSQKKYGPRGYRYVLLEAGHVAQNLCLQAVELGLGSLCMGGYVDSELNRALDLRTGAEGVVYSIAIGWPASTAE